MIIILQGGHVLALSVDKRKTKKLVEENLKIYSYYLLSVVDNDELIINKNTFEISLDINDKKISIKEENKLGFIKYIINRYNRLCIIQKKIIYFTYMIKEKNNDSLIANELGFDLNYYYRIKKEAIISMAYALNIEVYEGEEDEVDR
jgi:ArpU family phage transcriptional regulator